MKISKIVLTIDLQDQNDFDYKNENTDVIVQLENGRKYIACFFTYSNIRKLEKTHQQSADFLSGKYFWVPNMIIIDTCTKENIIQTINHLIEEGDFLLAFKPI